MTLTPKFKADKKRRFVSRICPGCHEKLTMPATGLCGYCLWGKPKGNWMSHHSHTGHVIRTQPLTNLRAVRKRVGLSMRRLSLESGVSFSAISDQERGKRDVVRSDVAERLAAALDVDVEELF